MVAPSAGHNSDVNARPPWLTLLAVPMAASPSTVRTSIGTSAVWRMNSRRGLCSSLLTFSVS
jgi:hypothetical protein